jgi:hypothetical protein
MAIARRTAPAAVFAEAAAQGLVVVATSAAACAAAAADTPLGKDIAMTRQDVSCRVFICEIAVTRQIAVANFVQCTSIRPNARHLQEPPDHESA